MRPLLCFLWSSSGFFFILANYFVHIQHMPMALLMILLTTCVIWETFKIQCRNTEPSFVRRSIQTTYLTSFHPPPMPIFSLIPSHVQDETLERCCICLDEMKSDVVMTPCEHSFHYNCLYIWLLHRHSCPLCLKEIPILK